jgi:hypothetical protein
MSSILKNRYFWCIIIIIIIVILAIVRVMGGSTWAEWWGLQIFNFGWFWGQRPLHPETVGLIAYGAMFALIIIIILIIYFFRDTFFKKG